MESLPRVGDGDGLVPGPSSFGCRRTVRFVGAPNDILSGSAMPAMALRCLRHDRVRERGPEQHRAEILRPECVRHAGDLNRSRLNLDLRQS